MQSKFLDNLRAIFAMDADAATDESEQGDVYGMYSDVAEEDAEDEDETF
ncbi:MAG: hypothetical protein RRZ93_02390 [Ruthenibacterium sp.]